MNVKYIECTQCVPYVRKLILITLKNGGKFRFLRLCLNYCLMGIDYA